MKCSDCLDSLQHTLDDRQEVAAAANVRAHLEECRTCRELFAAAERMQLGVALLPGPVAPRGFEQRVTLAVLGERRRVRRLQFVMRIAAALLIATAGLWAVLTQLRRQPADDAPMAPNPLLVKKDEPPPSLHTQFAEAREATYGLTRQLTQDTTKGALLFLPPPGRLPDATLPPPLETPAMSVDDVTRTVAEGFEPVTDSAKRAWGMFRRMMPGEERKKG